MKILRKLFYQKKINYPQSLRLAVRAAAELCQDRDPAIWIELARTQARIEERQIERQAQVSGRDPRPNRVQCPRSIRAGGAIVPARSGERRAAA